MIIQVSKITRDSDLSFNGAEAWMKEIYKEFPHCQPETHPLSIQIKIEILPGKRLKFSGNYSFTPLLECSRCALPIAWPLDGSIDATFEPEPRFNKETDLNTEDLDRYYYKDDQINLEQFINELIQLSRPDQVVKKSSDGSNCQICKKDIKGALVFGSEEKKKNPFEALKNLKLPH